MYGSVQVIKGGFAWSWMLSFDEKGVVAWIVSLYKVEGAEEESAGVWRLGRESHLQVVQFSAYALEGTGAWAGAAGLAGLQGSSIRLGLVG